MAAKVFAIIQATFKILKIKKRDIMFFQYPDYQSLDRYLIPLLRKRGIDVEFLVHDLDFMRSDWHTWDYEAKILGQAKTEYVHTEAMKLMLVEKGFPLDKMKCLYLFDYYSDDEMLPKDEALKNKNTVAFAGNLSKSAFLRHIPDSLFQNGGKMILYGAFPNDPYFTDSIVYGGKFIPENTRVLNAGWGLVWDGDSIDTCAGRYGEYLKYNSSHKLLLYLACGIPVIVWTQSSLAEWINERGIGISLKSLSDMMDVVNSISEDEYGKMAERCREIGRKLRSGSFLKAVL